MPSPDASEGREPSLCGAKQPFAGYGPDGDPWLASCERERGHDGDHWNGSIDRDWPGDGEGISDE